MAEGRGAPVAGLGPALVLTLREGLHGAVDVVDEALRGLSRPPVVTGDVVVPGELAPVVGRILRQRMREDQARNGFGWPGPLVDLVDALLPPAALRRHVAPRQAALHPVRVADGSGAELTPAQAAALIGVSRQAVMGRLSRGTLRGRQDDRGRWWVPREEIDGTNDDGAGDAAALG